MIYAEVQFIYIKERGAWHEDTALFPQVHNVGANFGNSFAMLDKHILVGANKIHANGFNSGMAYVYTQDNNNTWQVPYLQANAEIKSHDQFGLSVALGQEYMLAASKNAVFVFQNTPVQYYPAVFYPESNSVQLNEIAVADSGVFSVTFHSAQQESDFVLTLTESHLRADMQDSDTHYINNTQLLHIPRLAIPKNNGEADFFSVVLEQIQTPTMIQFRVVSFSPL